MILSVVIITHNEEANIGRTLASVQPLVADGQGEIIVVDSGSTDRTLEIAKSYGAKVFVEEWKGFAPQKNSAIDKAEGDWILSLDADEEVSSELRSEIAELLSLQPGQLLHKLSVRGAWDAWIEANPDFTVTYEDERTGVLAGAAIPRKNFFMGRWIRRGGFYPDRKLRLFKRGSAAFENRQVHEDAHTAGFTVALRDALIHHSYPTLADYIDHMNRYSSLGAEMAVAKSPRGFSLFNIVVRPWATFTYNYIFRLGFLDGREGLLLHLYHAVYVSWKYAKAWELSRKKWRSGDP
ncbi:MAG: glycosyltransferase family 2 protein [Terriglobales bacterium]|jgi:glycosyltransferase involved in cell wall biosynthesis